MFSTDVLMVTYDQPDYVRLSLPRLLDSCGQNDRVWLWHNGEHAETLETVRSLANHPRVFRFHHSKENVRLRPARNWLWENATGDLVGTVDDDCLVQRSWIQTLGRAHMDCPEFGAIGSWRFQDEDFIPELAERKIEEFDYGHRLLRNHWVQGSGHLLKRLCIERHGLLKPGQSFVQYCVELALAGWINGWYYPFVREQHLDDPRFPDSRLKSDADLRRRPPLTAARTGVTTLSEWEQRIRLSARTVQAATLDLRYYRGWRRRLRGASRRLKQLAGIQRGR